MRQEDDQELWNLLGRASPTEVSPFFARNVVRRIRERDAAAPVWIRWFSRPQVAFAGAAGVIALLLLASYIPRSESSASEALPGPVAQVQPQDYDVVADLDTLLALEENRSWTDTSSLY